MPAPECWASQFTVAAQVEAVQVQGEDCAADLFQKICWREMISKQQIPPSVPPCMEIKSQNN